MTDLRPFGGGSRMHRFLLVASFWIAAHLAPALPAAGQTPAPPVQTPPAPSGDLAGCRTPPQMESFRTARRLVPTESGVDEVVTFLAESVRIDCDDAQFFADHAEIYHDRHRITAEGNVLFVSAGNRITAGRMEFDTLSKTGTFYDAYGIASLGTRVDRSLFGTAEPDFFFWGSEVRKLGPRKYEIVDGNFTTCVQPTPRWNISSGRVTLNIDDYALLRNSVFRVKGVPLMYLPILYYPIQEDDRATGFLIPTYGASTVRGQSISNAFFWAIGRSHDATMYYDWFSKSGQGVGSEYRYELGGGSQGSSRVYLLNEKETAYRDAFGRDVVLPAKRSYQITGGLTQALGAGLRARASVDYFSDIVTQQRFQQNVYQATNRRRRIGGNVTGNWGAYVLSGTMEKNDVFYGAADIDTSGSLPRVTVSRGEQAIGRSPIYFGMTGESLTTIRTFERDGEQLFDNGLTRLDFNPVLRLPFTKWPFLTVNSSISWRGTYWTESRDAAGVQVPEGIGRRFFDLQTRITGPVFHRIFDTPENSYAERFKHVIEPTLVVQRITAIDNFSEIPDSGVDHLDRIVGGVTRLSYGLNNRLYAKKDVSREILTVVVGQTYYTDALAAQYDHNYESSFSGTRPTNFSPVSLQVRAAPTTRVQGRFWTEWDHSVNAFRTFGAGATVNQDTVQVSAGWSQRRFIPTLPGFDDPARADHYLNASTSIRGWQNRVGGSYAFNYDLRRDTFLQQRYLAYYNAQCCGFGVEYQTFNFQSGFAGVPVAQDRRFNISFTLAGIGSFSNVLGAFGGQQGR